MVLGGGSNGELWCQILADVLGTPVVRARSVETTCLGAGVGAYRAGWYASVDEAAAAMTEVGKRFEHDERAAATLWGTWLDDHLLEACAAGRPHPRTDVPLAPGTELFDSQHLAQAPRGARACVLAVASPGVTVVARLALAGIAETGAALGAQQGLRVARRARRGRRRGAGGDDRRRADGGGRSRRAAGRRHDQAA